MKKYAIILMFVAAMFTASPLFSQTLTCPNDAQPTRWFTNALGQQQPLECINKNGAVTFPGTGVQPGQSFGAIVVVDYRGIQNAIDRCPTANTGGCTVMDLRPQWLSGSGVNGVAPEDLITSTITMKTGVNLQLACGVRYHLKPATGHGIAVQTNSNISGCDNLPPYQGGTEIYFEGADGYDALNYSTNADWSNSHIRNLRVIDARASNVAGTRTGNAIFINRGTNSSGIENVLTSGFAYGLNLNVWNNSGATDGPNFFAVRDSFITGADKDCILIRNATETVLLDNIGIDNCGEADGASANTAGSSHYGAIHLYSIDGTRGNVIIQSGKYERSASRPNVTATALYIESVNGMAVTVNGFHTFIHPSAGDSLGTSIVVAGGTVRANIAGWSFTNGGGYGQMTNVIEDRFKGITLTVANWASMFSEILWNSGGSFPVFRLNGEMLANSAGGNGVRVCDAAHSCITAIDRDASGKPTVGSQQFVSTLATGTAPFSITSTTLVPNLNVDSVDSKHLLIGTGTLDFAAITAPNCAADLTLTVNSAAVGDPVTLGVPTASVTAGVQYHAWVSSSNTVTVRACAFTGSPNPASGSFTAIVLH